MNRSSLRNGWRIARWGILALAVLGRIAFVAHVASVFVIGTLSLAGLFIYMTGAGYTASMWRERHRARCPRVGMENFYNNTTDRADRCEELCSLRTHMVFIGLVWLAALPILLAAGKARRSSPLARAQYVAALEADAFRPMEEP